MDRLLTSRQAAALVGGGCGVDTIRRAFRNGDLAGVKVGRGYSFHEADVRAWVERLRQPAVIVAIPDCRPTARSAAYRRAVSA